MPERPRMLILSLSPLASDARVLKQIRGFAREYEVTTCGFGPSPHPHVEHLEITRASAPRPTRAGRLLGEVRTVLRRYRRLYWSNSDVREADALLEGRAFDVVLANDLDTAPLAMKHFPPSRVHLDLHEYWPRLRDEDRKWMLFRGPYYSWLCRRYAARAASTTTVGRRIAAEYARRFGFEPELVLNASPGKDLRPGPVTEPVRLVFSGVADRTRGLETIIGAVAATSSDLTLDLFLVPGPPAYMDELRALAGRSGSRVVIREPLPYDELVEALNGYDLGVYMPVMRGFNSVNALPNKLFDFAQARLGILVGPAPEMSAMVREEGIGEVVPGTEVADLVKILDRLAVDEVAAWKQHADAAAGRLSAERQQHVWEAAVRRIVDAGRTAPVTER
ncbi:glycosyltransferase family 1 protein [Agromyces sp. NPDC057679]|uniref:glycosyltransferase family 1 protein n=1 Tax=Agromyces sp. NPDC057679 TaxID=3346207 RepID=UPI00366DD967